MSKKLNKIISHPDKEEIISKIVIGVSNKDIAEWLKGKYPHPSESKYRLAESFISSFKNDYLDIYKLVQEDLSKTKALVKNPEEELKLTINNLPAYKNILVKAANEELDIRKIIKNLCLAIENRLSQVFDEIQENPREINVKLDRLLIEYADVLGGILEKYYQFTEVPVNNGTVSVQHNVTVQMVDQHMSVFHDVIKEVLSQMDLETSLYFMEVYTEKMSKLKMPEKNAPAPANLRLAEAQVLNETINNKIN